MWLHIGVCLHLRVCTESGLWEKNPLPHRGIEPASTVCGFDAVPTELHPNPIIISLKGPNTEPSVLRRRKGGRRLVSVLGFKPATFWSKVWSLHQSTTPHLPAPSPCADFCCMFLCFHCPSSSCQRHHWEEVFMTPLLTCFFTHDLEQIVVSHRGMSESPGFMCDTTTKIVRQESLKQLSTTLLNSINQGRTWQRLCIETWHVNKLWTEAWMRKHFLILCVISSFSRGQRVAEDVHKAAFCMCKDSPNYDGLCP